MKRVMPPASLRRKLIAIGNVDRKRVPGHILGMDGLELQHISALGIVQFSWGGRTNVSVAESTDGHAGIHPALDECPVPVPHAAHCPADHLECWCHPVRRAQPAPVRRSRAHRGRAAPDSYAWRAITGKP